MASVTAEVLLYFGTSDADFKKVVDTLRGDKFEDERSSREIIELLKPVYNEGYENGRMDMGDEL